jgi:crotonobetainyl-CoA:carnitine CoA-transferase CaiB-like acyl-CoA transferase
MRRLIPVWLAVALTLLAGSTDAWAKADGAPIGRPANTAPASPEASSRTPATTELASLDQSYRAREAKAAALENFEGGDVVVIGSTTLIVVLLVILIIVLI